MQYNFTDRTRHVLAYARDEALRLRHDYVSPDHVFLGLVQEGEGVAIGVLLQLGADPTAIGDEVRAALPEGQGAELIGELPYTSSAKRVLEHAMAGARDMSHSYVGTEHLLIGVVRAEQSTAATILREHGVTLERVREVTLGLLGQNLATDLKRRTASSGAPADASRGAPAGASRGALAGVPLAQRSDQAWFLKLDEASGTPIYEQIIARIEEAVATGQLEAGERLPSVRELAAELGIAPGTVARAYSELESRRVVLTEGARGTRVAHAQPTGSKRLGGARWLERLLRRIVVLAYHRGASAQDMRDGLERAMKGIFHIL